MNWVIIIIIAAAFLYFLYKVASKTKSLTSQINQPKHHKPEVNVRVSYNHSSHWDEENDEDRKWGPTLELVEIAGNKRQIEDYEWVLPGKSVEIAGYKIPDGMIYYGKYLKSVSNNYQMEPSFIKTDLKVSFMNPDREGKNLNYWPSYSEIPPSSRAAYLEWLAGGKVDPDIDIGYVFIFFYGLERRLLHDAERFQIPITEIRILLDKINLLFHVYGPKSGSFKHYANSLMEYVYLLYFVESKFYHLEPPSIKYTYEISSIVKLALGQLAKEGKPLTAKWMYEYVVHHPEINLRTPGRRCPKEFKKLFLIRYKEKFGEGIIVKPNKTKVKINYTCANSGLRFLNVSRSFDIPDVSILKTLLNKVRPIVDECQNELDKYSRWMGQKGNSKNSLIAYSFLPKDLTQCIENQEVDEFRTWLSNQLGVNENTLISNGALIKRWPVKTPGKITRKEFLAFISFLQKLGFGIEPDIRFGSESLKESGNSVLFRLDEFEDVLDSPSENYTSKFILLHFAVTVAKADDVITKEEQIMLIDSIENTHQLNPAEKRRMRNSLLWLLQADSLTKGLKRKVETLDQEQKGQLADYMVAVAGADGFISPEEVKMLIKLFKLLGFDSNQVYSGIHRYQTDQQEIPDNLVSVIPADSTNTGYVIPKQPALSKEQGFILDKEKIARKIMDTEKVSLLLEGVFDKDIPVEEPEEAEILEENEESIHGLDASHSAILVAFQKQSLWPRSQFEKLAAQYELMPDGALETLNEKAFDLFDDALCENEDPIEINQEILKEFFR